MRGKQAIKGTAVSMAYEMVTLICGLILPRLILERFGSAYNGLTASIVQFLSCVSLLKAGISAVTKAALYKPLAEKNTEKVSAVVHAAQGFIRRIAFLFLAALAVFACVYPFLVQGEFNWLFSASLVLILGISTFFQYYFGITYGMLMEADQKIHIVYGIQMITNILNTLFAALLIHLGGGIHMVKLGSALVFSLNPIWLWLYVKRHYDLRKDVPPEYGLIRQRWDAFAQDVAFFIHNNTDMMVLTILSTIREVSVYTVHNFVLVNLRQVVVAFINPFEAAFGDMLARKEMESARQNLRIYETVVFLTTTILYSVAAVMIVPFVMLYTKNVSDANYVRPAFAALMIIAGAFSCYRIPYKTIVDAAGHFRPLRNGAWVEAGLNIGLSVIAVSCWGLVGVALGTVAATVFRATQYAIYLQKTIIHRKQRIFAGRVALSLGTILLAILAGMLLLPSGPVSITGWIIQAVCTTLAVSVWTVITHLIIYRNDMVLVWQKLMQTFKRKR